MELARERLAEALGIFRRRQPVSAPSLGLACVVHGALELPRVMPEDLAVVVTQLFGGT